MAPATPLDMRHYDAMLAEGRHGALHWLADGRDQREDPARLLPNVRSVLVLAVPHGGALPPDPGGLTGRVARYAWGADYHNVLLRRLRKLQRRLRDAAPGVDSYAAVDWRPVFERAWAARAGLGWAGRNTCQLLPSRGSWFSLAVLFLPVALPPDAPMVDHCGRCTRCVTGCPTGALRGDGALDARLCLSTWTIELDGPLPDALRPQLGRWVFGCDDCQDVCPHAHDEDVEPPFVARHAWLDLPSLFDPPEVLAARFAGTPLARALPLRLPRNAALVLGNLGDPAAVPVLEAQAGRRDVVGDAARWALRRLVS